jgi:uncharacterized protein (DUF697 family)
MELTAEQIAAIVPLVILFTQGLKTLTKASGFVAQLLSWAVGVVLYIVFNGVSLESVVGGVLAALVANGVYSIEQVKELLRRWGP